MKHPSSELLALYAGRDLPDVEAQLIDEHIAICDLCRAEVSEIASSMAVLRALAVEPGASEVQALGEAVVRLSSRPQIRLYRIAGAAAILVAVSAGILWLVHGGAPTRDVITQVPPATLRLPTPPAVAPAMRRADGQASHPTLKKSTVPVQLAAIWPAEQARVREAPLRLKEVSRETETGEPVELRLATSNPKVIVLWQMSDSNVGTEEETEGSGGNE